MLQERNSKSELFKEKLEFFESKIKKVYDEIEERKSLIEKFGDNQDVFQIFAARQRTLTVELEKSLSSLITPE